MIRHRQYNTLCDPELVIHCSCPSCIAVHDSGDIYVTCWRDNSIQVFDQAGQQKRTIGSHGSGDGQFNQPYGLFIKGDVMYFTDWLNNCIQKMTTGGQFIQKFGHYGSVQGQFYFPSFVILDQRNRLIASDFGNGRVVILDQAGTWLLTINCNVTGSHAFLKPQGLALDPQGNIHYAADGSDSIKVITPGGTYVRSYGDVKLPNGIVIDEEGYSLVSELAGHCLSIFDPRGKKIHKIGGFRMPFAVMLDCKSSSLYVTDDRAVLKYSVSVM